MADDLTIRAKLLGSRRVRSETKGLAKDVGRVGDAAERSGRDARRAQGAFRRLGDTGRRGGGLLAGGLGRALALTGGVYTLGRAVGFAAGEWSEAAKVGAATNAVIRSTGGAAKVTAPEVENLAGAISAYAGLDDELIQKGANLLLTFKNVRNEVGRGNDIFTRATRGAVDLSAMGFGSVESASKMLGKALNDPVKGLTAMTRAGVTFSASQQEQIKGLVESGDRFGAQRVILRELESQVKGQARAQAQPIEKMRVGFGNIAESLAGLGAPTVNQGIDRVADSLEDLQGGLDPIFERKDLSLEQKLRLAAPVVQRDVGPLARELGDNLGKAFEVAAPAIADGAARAAPRVAGAFVNAFREAGPWGKLVTVGFLLGKMGAFNAAGGWAARRFKDRFGPQLTLKSIFRRAAREGAATGSATAAATMAAPSGRGSMAGEVRSRSGRWRRVGRIMGRGLALGVAAGIILNRDAIEDAMSDIADEVFGMFGGDELAPSGGGLSPDDTRPRDAPMGSRRRQRGPGAPEEFIAPDGRVWRKDRNGNWKLIRPTRNPRRLRPPSTFRRGRGASVPQGASRVLRAAALPAASGGDGADLVGAIAALANRPVKVYIGRREIAVAVAKEAATERAFT